MVLATYHRIFPSITRSSTPVTVTVCGVFQLLVVNVRLAGETVPSVKSLDDRLSVTLAIGWLESATVKVAVVPDSLTTRFVALRLNPAVSVSRLLPATVGP